MTYYPPIRSRVARNSDTRLRQLERACREGGGDECLAWLMARRRAGDEPALEEWFRARQEGSDRRDAFAAVLEEQSWHWGRTRRR